MNTPHFFGHVSSSEHQRGLFPVFYDVTERVSKWVVVESCNIFPKNPWQSLPRIQMGFVHNHSMTVPVS